MSLLWLYPKGKADNRLKYATALLNSQRIPATSVTFETIHRHDQKLWLKTSQRKWSIDAKKQLSAMKLMQQIITNAKPTVVVINCPCAAQLIFPAQFKDAQTLEKYRGSVYKHENYPNVAFIVVDDMFKCYGPDFGANTSPQVYSFIAAHDVQKVARYYKHNIRHFPDFEYQFITTPEDARDFARNVAENAIAYTTDVETSMDVISCVGFSALLKDGTVVNATIPILTGAQTNSNYHADFLTEFELWKAMKVLLESGVPCAMQNGRYDLDYFVKYNIRPRNCFYDTMLMMHSINGTLPKSLAFLASLYADNYYYWKEEIKGDAATADKTWRLPKTENGMNVYYKYCARDCYYTLQVFVHLLPQLAKTPWMLRNFAITAQQQYGPAYEMSTRGFLVNRKRKAQMESILAQQSFASLMRLKTAADDDALNPNSPKQMMHLFYDILGTPKVGKKRSTNEKILRRATFRNTMAYAMFRYVTEAKRPAKLLSTLRGMKLKHGRLFATFNAAGTWTGRYSSKKHNWWVGSNLQNVNKGLRPFMVADKGMVLVGIDYSQSDGYFVAHESEDEAYIELMRRNMNEGYDTHAHHVELMFGTPYDEVIKGKRNKAAWCVHPTTGQRQIIKRVVHGDNFGMQEDTMLTTVGVAEIIAAARILGFKTFAKWGDAQLKQVVKLLQARRHGVFKVAAKLWPKKLLADAADNMNRTVAYNGRTHVAIGNLKNDRGGSFARQLTAFKGQGGTAGNINRTLQEIYFNDNVSDQSVIAEELAHRVASEPLWKRGVQLVAQVHDEIIFQIPEQQLHLIDYILTIMQKPITINNRTFYVPAEAEIGYSWQVYVDYDSNKSNEEHLVAIRQAEAKYENKLSKGKL